MSRKIIAARINYKDPKQPQTQTLYAATEGVTIGSDFYEGRLFSNISYDFSVRAPWTGFRPVSAVGALSLANADGFLDNAYDWNFRDGEVTVKMLNPGEAWADGLTLTVAVVDSVTFDGLEAIRLNLRDLAAVLDTPVASQIFNDETFQPQALGQRIPVAFGTPLSVEPVLARASDNRYILSDENIVDIATVRVNGLPVQNYANINKGFTLDSAPDGRVTCDPIATGASNVQGLVVPSPAPADIGFSNNNKTVQNKRRVYDTPQIYNYSAFIDKGRRASDGGKWYFEIKPVRVVQNSANYNTAFGTFMGIGGGLAESLSGDQYVKQSGAYTFACDALASQGNRRIETYRDNATQDALQSANITSWGAGNVLITVEADFDAGAVQFKVYQAGVLEWTSSNMAIDPGSLGDLLYPAASVAATGAVDSRDQDNKLSIFVQPEDFERPVPSGFEAWGDSAYTVTTEFSDLVNEVLARTPGVPVNQTTVDEIDALGYSYSFYVRDSKTAAQVLFEACASFGGWHYISRTGELTFGYLRKPGSEPVAVFTDAEVIEFRKIELDESAGLSTQMGARRNWAVLDTASIDSGVSESQRAELSRKYRHEVAQENSTLNEAYSFADGNAILDTYFRTDANANAEVERIAALFTQERKIVTVDVAFEEVNFEQITLGSVISIANARYNLNTSVGGAFSAEFDSGFNSGSFSGKTFLVLGISGSFDRATVRLTLWS